MSFTDKKIKKKENKKNILKMEIQDFYVCFWEKKTDWVNINNER